MKRISFILPISLGRKPILFKRWWFWKCSYKAVGMDETDNSKKIWEGMMVKGFEKMEARKGESVLVKRYKSSDPANVSVKAVTSSAGLS